LPKKRQEKIVLKSFLYGLLSDLIAGLSLLIMLSFYHYDSSEKFYAVAAITLACVCSYLFNIKISFKRLEMDIRYKKRTALVIAVLTAPYLLFIPVDSFF